VIENVARPERLELPTLCSGGTRSIQLSYGRVFNLPNPITELAAAALALPETAFRLDPKLCLPSLDIAARTASSEGWT
jgi:hypothetical protein